MIKGKVQAKIEDIAAVNNMPNKDWVTRLLDLINKLPTPI